jgi:hypothetical protein
MMLSSTSPITNHTTSSADFPQKSWLAKKAVSKEIRLWNVLCFAFSQKYLTTKSPEPKKRTTHLTTHHFTSGHTSIPCVNFAYETESCTSSNCVSYHNLAAINTAKKF